MLRAPKLRVASPTQKLQKNVPPTCTDPGAALCLSGGVILKAALQAPSLGEVVGPPRTAGEPREPREPREPARDRLGPASSRSDVKPATLVEPGELGLPGLSHVASNSSFGFPTKTTVSTLKRPACVSPKRLARKCSGANRPATNQSSWSHAGPKPPLGPRRGL